MKKTEATPQSNKKVAGQINQDRDLRIEKAVYDHEAFLHLEEVAMVIAKLT